MKYDFWSPPVCKKAQQFYVKENLFLPAQFLSELLDNLNDDFQASSLRDSRNRIEIPVPCQMLVKLKTIFQISFILFILRNNRVIKKGNNFKIEMYNG